MEGDIDVFAEASVDFQKATSIQGILYIYDMLLAPTWEGLQMDPAKNPLSLELHNYETQERKEEGKKRT